MKAVQAIIQFHDASVHDWFYDAVKYVYKYFN